MSDENKEQEKALCGKCGKPTDEKPSDNWTIYHPECVTVEDLMAMATQGKRRNKTK